MPSLPEEIIVEEILSRLPFKSLIRFRSVCKSWNSLIASDSHLATLQFKNSTKNNFFDRRRVLLCHKSATFLLDKKTSSTNSSTFTVEKLNSPIVNGFSSIVASCDGLVCIHRRNNNNVLLFWSSLTGETKKVLPPPPTKLSFPYCNIINLYTTYGLGYDSSSDDFKLVRIYTSYYMLAGTSVFCNEGRVYSLRTNSWRPVESFPENFYLHEPGVFVNGALYWTVFPRNSPDPWKVVSFDLAKEKYSFLNILESRSWWSTITVGVLDEKHFVCFLSERGTHKLWLINEYEEDVESCSKHTITTLGNPGRLTPLCLLKIGEEEDQVMLVASECKLGLYNLKDGTFISHLQVPGMPNFFFRQ